MRGSTCWKDVSQRNRKHRGGSGREMCGKAAAAEREGAQLEKSSKVTVRVRVADCSFLISLSLPSHPPKRRFIRKEPCGIRWERPRGTGGKPFP